MKAAIQGHLTRGKEVIQILKSFGGKNRVCLKGNNPYVYYGIYVDTIMVLSNITNYKTYTLEEFEKEFPFKIGDKVIFPVKSGWLSGKIIGLKDFKYIVKTKYDNYNVKPHILQLYPMKKERNITLTLDKAKEWYQKGGELKEVALQAYSEEELIKIKYPKTWKEFCDNYHVEKGEAWIGTQDTIFAATMTQDRKYKNWISSKKSAEAHLAMMQLEQLRNCWRQGWEPTEDDTGYCILKYPKDYHIMTFNFRSFLSFPTRKMAEDFFECFRDLIEKAGDLI